MLILQGKFGFANGSDSRQQLFLYLSFTVIRKYSQQLIINADKQDANKNREHITFISGRFSAFCYAVERRF